MCVVIYIMINSFLITMSRPFWDACIYHDASASWNQLKMEYGTKTLVYTFINSYMYIIDDTMYSCHIYMNLHCTQDKNIYRCLAGLHSCLVSYLRNVHVWNRYSIINYNCSQSETNCSIAQYAHSALLITWWQNWISDSRPYYRYWLIYILFNMSGKRHLYSSVLV